MEPILIFKIFLVVEVAALALWGVYLLIFSEIKKENKMAHPINNDVYYPDGVFHDIDENGKHRLYDAFGEFYIRDTDHEKVYVHDDIELVNPILNQEYYPNNSEIQPKPYELKRKIDIDE